MLAPSSSSVVSEQRSVRVDAGVPIPVSTPSSVVMYTSSSIMSGCSLEQSGDTPREGESAQPRRSFYNPYPTSAGHRHRHPWCGDLRAAADPARTWPLGAGACVGAAGSDLGCAGAPSCADPLDHRQHTPGSYPLHGAAASPGAALCRSCNRIAGARYCSRLPNVAREYALTPGARFWRREARHSA